jgi:hypothetical protein
MQSVATDIQAMLIQAQSTAAAPASGTSTAISASTAAVNPQQKIAADLQTLLGDLQSATSPNAQTASTSPAGPVGGTAPHHHHHHHEEGGEASGATSVAGASTPAATSSNSTGDQAVSSMFAADITQALQAYGGSGAAGLMPNLTI